jgi:polysaccharide biosynthesis transport protein
MDLRQYARVLRAHWLLIGSSVFVCAGLAAIFAWTRPPVYAAEVQLYVSSSIPSSRASSTERYAAILLSQQRVVSYLQLVATPPVVRSVNDELGLSLSVDDFQGKVSAVRPEGTVLINVTVRDRSPELAKAIANALGKRFPSFLESLEVPRGQKGSSVKVTVTRPAQRPTQPVSPRKKLYLLLGTLAGLVLGVGAAVVREALSRRIRDAEDADTLTGLPVLGSIAEQGRAKRQPLVMANEPASAQAEEYRRVRTSLYTLIGQGEVGSFVISSPAGGEGKTVIAANLGIAFARSGSRVILVDADFRRPKLADVMGLSPALGLADVLVDGRPLEHALSGWKPGLELDVLAAGLPPPNPSELLGSRQFADVLDDLSLRADVVILDTPPVLPTTDATVLAPLTAGAILVARAGSTRADQLLSAVDSLESVHARVLGVVVNGLPRRSAGRRYVPPHASQRSWSGDPRVASELAVERTSTLRGSPSSRA